MEHLLILGASRGLGLALARLALAKKYRVTGLVRRRDGEVETLIRNEPERFRALIGDVRSELELERAARELDGGPLVDVLIYNAAIHLEHDKPDIEALDPQALLETLDVNVVGAARATKHFRRLLAPGALLVFISSEAGSIQDAWRQSEYGYCMSKAALNVLAKLLANRERALNSGIQVLALHPGWVRTDMGGQQATLSPEESAEAILSTLAERESHAGPTFVDRFGQAMAW